MAGVTLAGVTLASLCMGCGGPGHRQPAPHEEEAREPAPWELVEEGAEPGELVSERQPDEWDSLAMAAESGDTARSEADGETPRAESEAEAEMPTVAWSERTRAAKLGNLAEVFNDSNKYQWNAGERIGIRPIRHIEDAYYLRRPLVKVESCQWYDVDPLTHSIPFLVPEAARLLERIGRNFADSLASRNAGGHKFRVTSILRTAYSVKRLRRVNRNATDSSTHQLGTTFDISYAKFNHDGRSPRHSDEELKYILGEVLRDLRSQGACMVKYERKSPCFHITATGNGKL